MENAVIIPEVSGIASEEFGLQEADAKTIRNSFSPAVAETEGLVNSYEQILKAEMSGILCSDAKKLRLRMTKIRTSINRVHKAEKEYYLSGGRFVDAIKNKLVAPLKEMETKLKEAELHYEKIEEDKLEVIRVERNTVVDSYDAEAREGIDLAHMPERAFESFIGGLKFAKKQREDAEEFARQQAEKEAEEEAARQQAIVDENNRLAEQKQIAEAKALEIKEAQDKKDAEAKKIQEAKDKEIANLKAKADKEIAEKEAIIQKQKDDEAARIKSERLEKEAKIQAELNKGDAAKKKDLLKDLHDLTKKYEFKSEKNRAMYLNTIGLITKVIAFINK